MRKNLSESLRKSRKNYRGSKILMQCIEASDKRQKGDFLFQLSTCKLRVWIKARKRLSSAATPNNTLQGALRDMD
jgi:hypothetical protein